MGSRGIRLTIPRRGVGLFLAVGLASCAGSPAAPAGGNAARSGPALSGELAAAQQLVFSNHYRAADAAFATLVTRRPHDARSRAWYALFLNYRHAFPAALIQAQGAVGSRPKDGLALAVLCRVYDWSDQLSQALAAGHRAVGASPGEPLGHLFLSEALADHGDITAAADELGQAEPLVRAGSSPYLHAELAREQANLAHDRGDQPAQLTALAAARDAQPAWVERLGELAQVQLQSGQLAAAHATLEQAITDAPDDPGPLETLLAVALEQPDYGTAAALLPRARALKPASADLLDVQAQVDVALTHDPGAARQALLNALRHNPSDLRAAAYLLALARYAATGDEAAAGAVIADASAGTEERRGLPQPRPADPDGHQGADAATALEAVNAVRAQAGLRPVRLEPSLVLSAAAHTWYWLFNNADPGVAGLGIHHETPGLLGYRGVNPWDRAVAAGYPNRDVGEDITHRGSPSAAVADWVNSVYHRFAILRPDLVAIGYADVGLGPLAMEDMEFGFDPAPAASPPLVFPADGQSQVPAAFVDNELPDPVPAGMPRTTGYPVTITFPSVSSVRLTSFTLRDATGRAVDVYLIAPSPESENSAAVLAGQPLQPGGLYTAAVTASLQGRPYARTWTFAVAGAG